jgi:hypothetical protein
MTTTPLPDKVYRAILTIKHDINKQKTALTELDGRDVRIVLQHLSAQAERIAELEWLVEVIDFSPWRSDVRLSPEGEVELWRIREAALGTLMLDYKQEAMEYRHALDKARAVFKGE